MWPTPTPMPTQPPPELLNIDVEQVGQDFTMGIVQGWNWLDSQPFTDVVWFIVLALVIVLGLISIRNRLQQNV